jgi:hypothetical protein
MKLTQSTLNLERPEILRAKRSYGFWYGVVLGFGFSVFTWGTDAYILTGLHGLLPWVKFVVGSILYTGIGGIAGWLSARGNKPVYALFFWLVAAFAFARLTVNIPLKFVPQILSIIAPATSGLLHYVYYPDLGARVGLAYTWIGIFVAIAGLLQLPMSESAVFSDSRGGKIFPMLVCVVLMSICGTIVDNGLINESLRSAIKATDNTIQYVIDNRGKEVDLAEARQMHAGAFRTIQDAVTQKRKMIVSGYDKTLGDVDILIQFESSWVECQVLYNQPVSCKLIEKTK